MMSKARNRERNAQERAQEAEKQRIAFADDNFYTGLVVGLIMGIVACVIW